VSTPRASAPAHTIGTAQGVWLVAEREIGSKLRSKAFVISTAILFALALAGILIGSFAAQNAGGIPVAVTSQTASVVSGIDGIEATEADSDDDAIALVEKGEADAALVAATGDSAFDYKIVADDSAPQALVSLLSVSPPVELLDPDATDGFVRYIVSIGFGILFFGAAMTFGSTIAQSVVEEKQTRVVEILISAIPVRTLLAGKVLGNTILAMGQVIGLAVISVVGLAVTGQSALLQGLGSAIVWFAIFFLFGFVLLAALFSAAAAMVSRQEDIGSTTTPLIFLVMAPYFLVIFFNDNPVVMTVMSYVPFSAAVGMPVRLFLGEAQWWEPLVALVILLATCVGAILVGAKIYQNSLLRMGARVKLSEALRG
jgi:ABC-2 type transport system permease protein